MSVPHECDKGVSGDVERIPLKYYRISFYGHGISFLPRILKKVLKGCRFMFLTLVKI